VFIWFVKITGIKDYAYNNLGSDNNEC
jgi:hypothetical protein